MYKFKSPATADLIMLEPNGRQLVALMGKDYGDNSTQGILLPEEMPAAIHAIRLAIVQDEKLRAQRIREALAVGAPAPVFEGVSLKQRALPMIAMLERCHLAQKEMVWGN
ncbi:DUF1840 domain-containing protein [Rhodoferax sp.]|jgi:hypothetical protein|uniref:DUF1840 domain-containing protein n=1 Tax=Rhodoferax sp. TaxID=50421 RepID=UPI003783A51A